MGWKKEHKAQSREKIIDSAAWLFTRHGFDSVSIDQVMQHAGLTRGAFYAHFKNKAELYQHAILAGAKQAKLLMEAADEHTPAAMAEHYLRIGDENHADNFCPLAFFVTDMVQREKPIQETYTMAFEGYVNILEGMGLAADKARQTAVLMIGGLAISRAITDEGLKEEVIQACMAGVMENSG